MPVTVPIQLKRSAAAETHEAFSAWYLPTRTASEWVEECSRWPSRQSAMLFFPLPGSPTKRRVDGVIVLLENETLPGKIPNRGTGLVLVGHKIFVPTGFTLSVPLSRREIDNRIPRDLAVFLPSNRWVSFDKKEGLGFHDLLEPFSERGISWNRAIPVNESPPRLTGIEVSALPGLETMMRQWRDDIGTDNPAELPGSDPQSDRRKNSRERFYEQILRFTQSRPEQEGIAPTWVNRLEDWASQRLSQMAQQNGELERLIDLLKSDPDEGLKFAMPLSGDLPGGRGMAPPGGSLSGRRNIQFNLSNLFGSGGAISPWMIDNDQYLELQRSYREAANRELQLRRYRRAAFIFGELLGDMSSAANALEQGNHYAEAAVLYEKKLSDKRSAARAFQKAGMIEESLRLYRELEEHEEVGRLLRDLGRIKEAGEAFQEAVESCLRKNLRLDAARIAEQDLEDEEYALKIYRDSWPAHANAGECLRREIELLASSKGHDAVEARLRSLAIEKWRESESRTLLKQLIHSKYQYPNDEVAAVAGDLARTVVSLQLNDPHSSKSAILELVPGIDPADRLLLRDAKRFRTKKSRIPEVNPAPPALRFDHSVTLVAKYERSPHPSEATALAACAWQGNAVVASVSPKKKFSVTISNFEDGAIGGISYQKGELSLEKQVRLLVMQSRLEAGDQNIVVNDELGSVIPFRSTGPDNLSIGNNELFNKALGLTSTESGQTWKIMKSVSGELYLESTFRGNILETHHLISIPPELLEGIGEIPMVASRNTIYFGMGNHLARWQNSSLAVVELPSPILDLAASPATTRSRVAVAMESGFAVAWGDRDWTRDIDFIPLQIFDEDLRQAKVTFLGSGHLVVAGVFCMAVFSVGKDTVTRQGGYAMPRPGTILAVVPTKSANEFEVITPQTIIGMELKRSG